jgi:hypothetical protein
MKKAKTEDVRAEIVSRKNAVNGRYRLGRFKLEFWDNNYIEEGPNIVRARADIADYFIEKARLSGIDIDDENVLKEIAEHTNSLISKRIIRNRITMFFILIIFAFIIFKILSIIIFR